MGNMTFIALGALILVAILAVVVVVASGKGSRKTASDYALRPTLSANEADFFYRLVRANGEGYVFAQVAMSALIEPATKDRKARASAFNRIARKRVDYAVYTDAMKLLCVVELDDRTHKTSRDAERDAMLASAGIQTVRWQSKSKPDVADIRAQFDKLRDKLLNAH